MRSIGGEWREYGEEWQEKEIYALEVKPLICADRRQYKWGWNENSPHISHAA